MLFGSIICFALKQKKILAHDSGGFQHCWSTIENALHDTDNWQYEHTQYIGELLIKQRTTDVEIFLYIYTSLLPIPFAMYIYKSIWIISSKAPKDKDKEKLEIKETMMT